MQGCTWQTLQDGTDGRLLESPDFGYCASQNTYYFGYKLHALCGLNGVIHSYDLSKASVYNPDYMKDVKNWSIMIAAFTETKAMSGKTSGSTSLKRHTSGSNVLTASTKRIGSRLSFLSPRHARGLKPCFRN